MQGQGSADVNIDEGSSPDNAGIDQPDSLGNILSPVGTRLSDHAVSSGGTMHGSTIAPEVRIFGGWNSGDPSSRWRLQDQVIQGARADDAPRLEERQIEPPNVLFPGRLNNGRSSNQIGNGPMYLQGSGSTHSPQSLNLTEGFISRRGTGHNLHNSSGLEREQISNVGSSSGSSSYAEEEYNDGSGSSLGSWGLSCKRKSVEGTSRQSYTAGTSSNSQQLENVAWHASSRSDSSAPTPNFLNVSPPVQLNPSVGLGTRGVASDVFPSSSSANREVRQESLPFSLSSTGVAEQSSFGSPIHPRAAIAGNSNYPSTQPHMRTISVVPRSVHPFPWNVTSGSRPGYLSGSINPVERAAVLSEEPNIRNIPRNNAELPMFVPETVMRHVAQDPTGWSLASENISTSGGFASNRLRPSSSIQFPSWNHPRNPPIHYQQRLSEFSPWSVFPQLSSGPSASSQETPVPSRSNSQGNNRTYPTSASISGRQGDDVPGMPHSLRALAADIEGRHRLISEIRHVLASMRRGENVGVEDYMMFEPFIHHDMAEIHDRHRDMRLDVDNMSYEELLALGEQIGDVSTGLDEETVLKLMKWKKYSSVTTESAQASEPCCICQEEYADGDDIGILNCGHDFHANCIKQWLMVRNLCPICKTTGLLK